VPVRSFVRHGETVVQGDLTATLRRGNGTLVGRTTRHDVTLPIKAPGAHTASASGFAATAATAAASCTILHLVLGPLDLNLLGLMVHLDPSFSTSPRKPARGTCWATCCAQSQTC
jgi:hypothetical protein